MSTIPVPSRKYRHALQSALCLLDEAHALADGAVSNGTDIIVSDEDLARLHETAQRLADQIATLGGDFQSGAIPPSGFADRLSPASTPVGKPPAPLALSSSGVAQDAAESLARTDRGHAAGAGSRAPVRSSS